MAMRMMFNSHEHLLGRSSKGLSETHGELMPLSCWKDTRPGSQRPQGTASKASCSYLFLWASGASSVIFRGRGDREPPRALPALKVHEW